MSSQAVLRKHLVAQRRTLPRNVHRAHARKIRYLFCRRFKQVQGKHIALYRHAFGEVHTTLLIQYLLAKKARVYLPVVAVAQASTLIFRRIYSAQPRLRLHSLGFKQPCFPRGIRAKQLNMVIMPLVAVNAQGVRMGMGGGYYDRTFVHARHVIRVGIAHPFQTQCIFAAQPWDIRLHQVITPQKITTFSHWH